jgi:histidinol-phosphatase
MTDSPAVETHLALALELADEADAITTARFRAHDLRVETKPDLTPVSEADRAVEVALRERIAAATSHSIVGEEFDDLVGDRDEYRWIIDPIDGTKNYVRGVPIWATLVGLEYAGTLVVGVVSAPALGMRWWAGQGLGAFRDGLPIHVSSVSVLDDAQISYAFDNPARHANDPIASSLMRLSGRCWRTRGIGDFWQHMLVAEGAFDISVDPIVSLWDVAALIPIVAEAGGRWSTLTGSDDAAGGSLVCTNGRLHADVLGALTPTPAGSVRLHAAFQLRPDGRDRHRHVVGEGRCRRRRRHRGRAVAHSARVLCAEPVALRARRGGGVVARAAPCARCARRHRAARRLGRGDGPVVDRGG